MRPVVVIITLFILVGAMVLTFLPSTAPMSFDPQAPGQFPLNQRIPTWPGKQRIVPYRPGLG